MLVLRPLTRGSPDTRDCRILLFLWSFGPLKKDSFEFLGDKAGDVSQ